MSKPSRTEPYNVLVEAEKMHETKNQAKTFCVSFVTNDGSYAVYMVNVRNNCHSITADHDKNSITMTLSRKLRRNQCKNRSGLLAVWLRRQLFLKIVDTELSK